VLHGQLLLLPLLLWRHGRRVVVQAGAIPGSCVSVQGCRWHRLLLLEVLLAPHCNRWVIAAACKLCTAAEVSSLRVHLPPLLQGGLPARDLLLQLLKPNPARSACL
jgi:hypothetical protein